MPINYNIDLKKNVNNNMFADKRDNSSNKYKTVQDYYCKAWSEISDYNLCYELSIKNPCKFWDSQLASIYWKVTPTKSLDSTNNKWCPNSISNICYNCVDRHAASNPSKVAIVWHGDDPKDRVEITYKQLLILVQNIANLLLKNGIIQ